jgi:hypothetical protein
MHLELQAQFRVHGKKLPHRRRGNQLKKRDVYSDPQPAARVSLQRVSSMR